MIVYLIENSVNHKLYIGKTTVPFKRRWQSHCGDSRRGAKNPFARAIRKYGEDVFVLRMTWPCATVEGMNALERRCIEEYGTHISTGNGYNATWGGDGTEPGERSPAFGTKRTPEVRRALSDSKKGSRNPSAKASGPNHWNRGLVRSEETRSKIRAKRALQITRKGFHHSPEVREKLSIIQKRIMSDPKERLRVGRQTKEGMARRKALLRRGQQELFL